MKLSSTSVPNAVYNISIIAKVGIHLIFLIAILQSCSKDENTTLQTNGAASVNISISGVEDENTFIINESEVEDEIARASIARTNIFTDEKETVVYDIQTLPEFDVLSDVQSSLPSSSSAVNIIDSSVVSKAAIVGTKAIKGSSKAVTRMEAQTRYRIIFYEQGSTTVASNNQAIAGTAMEASLDVGKTYNWYAVSINATTVPNINSSGVIARSSLANRDVLYASGVITPVFGANTLQITFSRRTARIEVNLNVRGMFGRIRNNTSLEIGWRSGTTFNSVIQMGDLNIRTGNYTNITNSSAVTGASMTATATNTGDAVKNAVFYTVRNNNIANGSLTVRLNRLDLTMDDGGVRSFNTATLVPISGAMTPTYGSRSVINARLIESAMAVNGTRFARTNLIYDPANNQVDRYRFRPHNNYARPNFNNEYWRFQGNTPTGPTGNVDPCQNVYPNSVWKSPRIEDFRALGTNGLVTSGNTNGVRKITKHWNQTGNAAGNASGYPSNVLTILYLGFYNENGVLQEDGERLGSASSQALADHWLNTAANNTTAGVARYRVTQYSNGVVINTAGVILAQSPRSMRRPIRCHRR